MPYYPLELIWEDYLSLSDSEFPVRFRYSAVDISRPKYINGDANLAVRRSPVLHISYSSSRHYSIFIVCSSMLRTIDGGSSRVISDHVIEYTAAGFCSAPKCHGLLICFLRLPITSLHLHFQPRLLLEVQPRCRIPYFTNSKVGTKARPLPHKEANPQPGPKQIQPRQRRAVDRHISAILPNIFSFTLPSLKHKFHTIENMSQANTPVRWRMIILVPIWSVQLFFLAPYVVVLGLLIGITEKPEDDGNNSKPGLQS